jgi:hypothetical protein
MELRFLDLSTSLGLVDVFKARPPYLREKSPWNLLHTLDKYFQMQDELKLS